MTVGNGREGSIPVTFKVVSQATGQTIAAASGDGHLRKVQPNGAGCAPICYSAGLTYDGTATLVGSRSQTTDLALVVLRTGVTCVLALILLAAWTTCQDEKCVDRQAHFVPSGWRSPSLFWPLPAHGSAQEALTAHLVPI